MFTLNDLDSLPKESPLWQVLTNKDQRANLHDLLLQLAIGDLQQDEMATDEMCRSRIAKVSFVRQAFNILPDGTKREYSTAELDPLDQLDPQ